MTLRPPGPLTVLDFGYVDTAVSLHPSSLRIMGVEFSRHDPGDPASPTGNTGDARRASPLPSFRRRVGRLLRSVDQVCAGHDGGHLAIIGVWPALQRRARLGVGVIRRRSPLGRVLMLALALVNLVVLPFGTALGIYALWTLLTNEGRRLFELAGSQ